MSRRAAPSSSVLAPSAAGMNPGSSEGAAATEAGRVLKQADKYKAGYVMLNKHVKTLADFLVDDGSVPKALSGTADSALFLSEQRSALLTFTRSTVVSLHSLSNTLSALQAVKADAAARHATRCEKAAALQARAAEREALRRKRAAERREAGDGDEGEGEEKEAGKKEGEGEEEEERLDVLEVEDYDAVLKAAAGKRGALSADDVEKERMVAELKAMLGQSESKKRRKGAEADDDEIEMEVSDKQRENELKCPYAGGFFVDPHTNNVCNHTFSKTSLDAMFAKNATAKCPVPGCANKTMSRKQFEQDFDKLATVESYQRRQAKTEAAKKKREMQLGEEDFDEDN